MQQVQKPGENNHYYQNSTFPGGADPGIIKSGDTYYIYVTGTHCGRKTKNFRSFEEFCYSLDGNNGGFWAPEVYYYNNKYYLLYTNAGDGNWSIKGAIADSPEGPFKDSFTLGGVQSDFVIDHTILFDSGQAYLYKKLNVNGGDGCARGYCNSVIFVERLSSDLKSVISEARIALEQESVNGMGNLSYLGGHFSPIDGYNYWENGCIEGPSVFRKSGRYYLLYSAGHFESLTYTVGYAEAGAPGERFSKVTLGNNGSGSTAPLLHGLTRGGNWSGTDVNGSSGAYGTGHGFVLKISDDEMYYFYHSRNYGGRKTNMDYLGVDENGTLFINGPTATEKNPAPSGVNGVYRLPNSKYNVMLGGAAQDILKDYININAKRSGDAIGKAPLVNVATASGTQLRIVTGVRKHVEDVWLFAGERNLSGTAHVTINNKYEVSGNYALEGVSTKIQLPTNLGDTRIIDITFSENVSLSDVWLYTTEATEEKEVASYDDLAKYENRCGENGVGTILLGTDNCYQDDGAGGGFQTVFGGVAGTAMAGVGLLGLMGLIIAGIMYMSARGNEMRVQKAKKRLVAVVIGLVFYAVMYALIRFLWPEM